MTDFSHKELWYPVDMPEVCMLEEPFKVSLGGSKYWKTSQGILRLADHWGRISESISKPLVCRAYSEKFAASTFIRTTTLYGFLPYPAAEFTEPRRLAEQVLPGPILQEVKAQACATKCKLFYSLSEMLCTESRSGLILLQDSPSYRAYLVKICTQKNGNLVNLSYLSHGYSLAYVQTHHSSPKASRNRAIGNP